MSKDNKKILPTKIKKLRDRPPRTKEHLDHYIQFFYGVHLASMPIEPGNSSPLDFVWDVFSSAMNYKGENSYYFLGLATRGGQKCTKKDIRIFSTNGCKKICEINNDIVSSYPKASQSTNLEYNGVSDIYRLETHDGYYFEGTFNHRIAYFDSGIKYKILKDFCQDDYVLIGGNELFNTDDAINIQDFKFEYIKKEHSKHYDSIILPTKQDFDLGYLIGGLVGDGCFTVKNRIFVSDDEPTILNKYVSIFKDKFNIDLNILQKQNILNITFSNRKIKEFFNFLGIDNSKSINKTIPKIVWNGTKDFVIGFLSGLFDTDGSITFKNKKRRAINFTFANEQFTRDLQLILLNFGIKSHFREANVNYEGSRAFHLKIESVFALKFAQLIKSFSDKKSKKINDLVNNESENFSGDYFPASAIKPLIFDIREYYCKNFRYKNRTTYVRNKIRSLDYKAITRRKIKNFLDVYSVCKDCEAYRTLEFLINNNTFFNKVKKVESLGIQDDVYDISVPENENFFANGILVHNSLSCAVLEMLLMQHDPYRDFFHMASIKQQAYATYDYFKKFYFKELMKDVLRTEPTMRESISHSGTKLSIGTATMDSVNCIAGDSLILTNNGFYLIEDLYIGDKVIGQSTTYENLTNPSYLNNDSITHVTYQGRAKTIKIEFENGAQIDVTPNHNCLVFPSLGEGIKTDKVLASNLKIGDILAFGIGGAIDKDFNNLKSFKKVEGQTNSNDLELPTILNEDLSYLIGLIIGDGGLSIDALNKNTTGRGGRITYTSGDFVLFEKFKEIFRREFKFNHKITEVKKSNNCQHLAIDNITIKRFFNNLGLKNVIANYKRIPSSILKTSIKNQWQFISGFFDTDGTIRVRNFGKYKSIEILFYSSSRKLLQDLQAVLLSLNVGSNIRLVKRNGEYYKNFTNYYLAITWGKNIFLENVSTRKDVNSKKYMSLDLAKKTTLINVKEIVRTLPKELFGFKSNPFFHRFPELEKFSFQKIVNISEGEEIEVYDLFSPDRNLVNSYNSLIFNSFHGSTIQDELELTPEKIFNESKGMLSAQRGKLPLNICISSRKFGFGNIQKLIDQAAKDPSFPYKIHKWGILEVTEKCHESRNGGEFGHNIWVNDDDLMAVSEDQYNILSQLEKTKYSQKKGYKNCLSCGIFSFCQGRLPNQKENNLYLQPIDTIVSQFKTEDSEFFKSQRLNRKPSTKGLIYYSWDESIHVRTYAQMYEVFMGEPHPDTIKDPDTSIPKRLEITFEELTNLFIKQGGRFVIGVDFGFSILAVAGLYYIDGADRVYFLDEIARQGFTELEFAKEMKRNWGHLPIEMVYADPENPSGGKQIRQTCGWAVSKEVDKSVKEGIGTVRNKMRIPGTKNTMFFVSYVCTVFIDEVKIYRNKINPVTQEPIEEVHKENDHSCDQVRYVIHSIFGKTQPNYDDKTLIEAPQNFNLNNGLRAPNAVELGTTLGIQITDNREKINQPQEELKEEKISHGGTAFSWSW